MVQRIYRWECSIYQERKTSNFTYKTISLSFLTGLSIMDGPVLFCPWGIWPYLWAPDLGPKRLNIGTTPKKEYFENYPKGG
jgi:hypothetical protein